MAEGQAEMPAGQAGDDRGISVGRDASGNAFVTGDNNHVKVVIYQAVAERREPEEPPSEEIGPNPYMGLLAFHETEADRFFGREQQTRRLWEKLRDLQSPGSDKPSTRLLPVLGPSGSGKSSLARAGLIAELARQPLPGMRDARVAVLTPGAHPLEALAGVLARIATDDSTPVAKTREFNDELKLANDEGAYDGLRRIADSLPEIASVPLIVLVDQFEEIYSLCDDKTARTAFIENLLQAASDAGSRTSVVITLRTDFLGETQTHEALNRLVCAQQIMVPAMDETELRAAIAKPAELAGHPLDDATITLLTSDAKDREGALPLLQFALTRIWDGMTCGVAPAETYQKIGGVGGALAGEAQRIYDQLGDDEKRIAKRVFLGLVQLGEGTRDTRRRAIVENLVSVGEDASEVERVIRCFAGRDARLITLSSIKRKDSDTSEEAEAVDTAEVTHEALFDHWDQLNDWLDENREDVRFSRHLDEAALTWKQQGHPEGGLWQPPNLDLLSEYHARVGNEMTPLQIDFFIASKKARRTRQLIVRGLVGAVGAIAVVAIVALGFALSFGRSASEARSEVGRVAIDGLIDAIFFAPPAVARERMESLADVTASEAMRNYSVQGLRSRLDESFPSDTSPAEWDVMASRKANLAVAMLRLTGIDEVRRYLKHDDKPALRSHLIHRFSQADANPDLIAAQIDIEQEPFICQALILSLGEFDESGFSDDKRETFIRKSLLELYRTDPDPGVHAASEWLLRKWGHNGDVQEFRSEVVRGFGEGLEKETKAEPVVHRTSDGKRGWYVNSQRQTMVIIKGQVEFLIGSPEIEEGREPDESQQPRTLVSYAIADKEVTRGQFPRFLSDEKYLQKLGMNKKDITAFVPTEAEAEEPVVAVTWYMAAAYCNWLTEQEMGEEKAKAQLCYVADEDGKFGEGMRIQADFLKRTGYRLPTEAEWEYACRGGATSAYCFGETESLLDKYAWYDPSGIHWVGALKPNGFGIFDMHGNAVEWCQEAYIEKYTADIVSEYLTVTNERGRVLRGGSSYVAPDVRSAYRYSDQPDNRLTLVGFRVARTYP